jgi:hypothetical protein
MRSGLIPSWNRVPSSVGPRSEVGAERKTLWTEGFGRGVWCRDHWLKADPMRLCAPRRGIGKSAPSSASVKPSMIVSTPSAVQVAGRSTRLGQERLAALTWGDFGKGWVSHNPQGWGPWPFQSTVGQRLDFDPITRGMAVERAPSAEESVFWGIYLWFMPRLQQDSTPFARGVRKDDAPESKRLDESVCCES